MVSKIQYGNTNIFFIRGIGGNLLVDTDYAGTMSAFYRAIKQHDISLMSSKKPDIFMYKP